MANRRLLRTDRQETSIRTPAISQPIGRAPLLWWAAFLAVAFVLLIPLGMTEIPPLLDYPNHLARMDILANVSKDADLARIYGANWQIVPNIGIDLAMPALMHVMSLTVAGKVFLALALLLPLIGVVVLHRVVFRTVSYWPLAAGLVVYNRLFFTGFVNFEIGIGLALLGAALWYALLDGRAALRVGTAVVVALVIFFCHLIAAGFYGLLLLGFEAHRARRLGFSAPRLLLMLLPFVVPAIFYLHAPISEGAADQGRGLVNAIKQYYWAWVAGPPGLKPYGLLGPFLTYDRLLDTAAVLLVLFVLGLCAFIRRLKVMPAVAGIFALLLIAYPVIPFTLLRTSWIDQRLPILAGFLLFAGTLPVPPTRRTAMLIGVALGVAIGARTFEIAAIWARHDAVLADFRQVIAPVGPGDRVLVVQAERNGDMDAMVNRPDSVRSMRDNDSTMHLPALLVFEHKAFWPLLFSAPSKQPVKVLPPYTALSLPEGELPWIGGLAALDPGTLKFAPYLPGWEKKFDWVLVMRPAEAPHGYDLLPARLEPVTAGKIAALYRIKK